MADRAPLLLLLAASGAGLAPVAAAPQEQGARFALLPLRNLSDDADAPYALFARVRGELELRGASFVPEGELEGELRRRRVRYTDSVSAADVRAIADATGAEYVLAGTLIDYEPGLLPRVSLALRAIDARTGQRSASSVVTLRGEDFEGLLGLGRIEDEAELVSVAIDELLADFGSGGAPVQPAPRPDLRERTGHPKGGWGFMVPDFDPAAVESVAVLPLNNRSMEGEGATVFAELLGDAWFGGTGVQVVEPGEVRAALVALKVRSMDFVDLQMLAELGRTVGTRWFALGSIERFGDEVIVGTLRYPEVEATIELLDVESGRIVAASGVRRRGDHYETVLGLGAVRNSIELAQRAAREIVAALGG